ncbi:hypothetical protein VTG60DRAFT_3564 [Thermothelomyces hinnuleus]
MSRQRWRREAATRHVRPAGGERELGHGKAAVPEGLDGEVAGEGGLDAEEGTPEHFTALLNTTAEKVVLGAADLLEDGAVFDPEGSSTEGGFHETLLVAKVLKLGRLGEQRFPGLLYFVHFHFANCPLYILALA